MVKSSNNFPNKSKKEKMIKKQKLDNLLIKPMHNSNKEENSEKKKSLSNLNIKRNSLLKKHKIDLNSKLKKKIKLTKKLLKFDEEKINNTIKSIKIQNEELIEQNKKEFYNNFYAYIILKNKLDDEIDSDKVKEFKEKTKKYSKYEIEKVGDLNDPILKENNKNKVKNFYFKLPVDFIDTKNNLKILFVNSVDFTQKKKKSLNNEKIKKENKNSEEENYQLIEKILEVKFKDLGEVSQKHEEKFINNYSKRIEIKSVDEFMEIIKSTKQKLNLNFLYKIFICDEKLKSRLNNIFTGNSLKKLRSETKLFNLFDDIIDINFLNFGKNPENNLKDLSLAMDLSQRRSLVKNLNNKIFKIKFANCSNSDEDVKRNFNYLSVNLTSFLLSKSNKYNAVKSIIIKSENSIPFLVYGELDVNEIDYFNI